MTFSVCWVIVAEAGAQVVVDIRGQVGDSVVEHLLPQRGLLQRVLGLLLAPLQLVFQPFAGVRVVERRQLGIHRQRQMLCGRANLGDAPDRGSGRSPGTAPCR